MTADQILALLRAIGGEGYIEHEAGISRVVERVSESRKEVFDPVNDSDDAMRVMAWLLPQRGGHVLTQMCLFASQYAPGEDDQWHGGTPAGLRSAITRAAVRVAEQ